MNNLRARAKQLRERMERGEKITEDELLALCVPLGEALAVFSDVARDNDELVVPVCCGQDTECNDGLLVGEAHCKVCGATILSALAPLSSPFLPRGNAYVTVPSEEFREQLRGREWFVAHEGRRGAA